MTSLTTPTTFKRLFVGDDDSYAGVVPAADISHVAGPYGPIWRAGSTAARDYVHTAVPIDDLRSARYYGATGDGSTDDTTALAAWLTACAAAGVAAYLPTGTYITTGLTQPSGLTRVFGDGNRLSILKRKGSAANNASIWSASTLSGFTIADIGFDGNKANQTLGGNSLTLSVCSDFRLDRVRAINAKAASGYGSAIVLNLSPTTNTTGREIAVTDCEAYDNDASGLHILRTGAAIAVRGGTYSANTGSGISYDRQGITPVADTVPNLRIIGVRAERNTGTGISVAGFTVVGLSSTQTYGHGSDPAYGTIVSGCQVNYNAGYGIFVQATGVVISGNTTRGNGTTTQAGICANAQGVVIADNIVRANKYYGIDAGGCLYGSITGNQISLTDNGSAAGTGLNLGASQHMMVRGNTLVDNGTTQIYLPRYDAGAYWFPWDAVNVTIDNNILIETRSTNNFGILTAGLPDDIYITNNRFVWPDTTAYNAIRAGLTTGIVQGNMLVGNSSNALGSNATASIVYPEWVDTFAINTDTAAITALLSRSQQQNIEKITAAILTNRGTGYTADFDVILTGGGGTGASLRAHVTQDGRVAAVEIVSAGSGFTSVPTLSFTNGAGTGAAATASVGVPNLPGKELKFLGFTSAFRMTAGTTILPSYTGTTITIAARGSITLRVIEAKFYPVSIESGNGWHYYANGRFDGEGAGTPEGVVTAGIGSTWRRTDGGAGTSFYVKESGIGNTGWAAK